MRNHKKNKYILLYLSTLIYTYRYSKHILNKYILLHSNNNRKHRKLCLEESLTIINFKNKSKLLNKKMKKKWRNEEIQINTYFVA